MSMEQINSKVVAATVAPGREVLAYRGTVGFSPVHSGAGGLGGLAGRALSGEHVAMMVAQGEGTVYYGFGGAHLTLIELDGSGPLTVEADRLVAHDAGLQSSVVSLGGQGGVRGAVRGAATGQGLFTTRLAGRGAVAILSHGGTIALPITPGVTTTVDPQAFVAHVGQVQADLAVKAGWRDAVGRGSGEAVQLRMTGQGTVYVQASEQRI